MMYWGNGSGWGMVLMTVSMVAFWGLLIAALVLLVRSVGGAGQSTTSPGGPDPRRILAERYARGEIDEQEYHSRLAGLR
ncbi:MAG: SHOCT domain-containing protein [Hamadaea sp.]|nr:SHOCT domain-containing protein [Hamadaea sp.]